MECRAPSIRSFINPQFLRHCSKNWIADLSNFQQAIVHETYMPISKWPLLIHALDLECEALTDYCYDWALSLITRAFFLRLVSCVLMNAFWKLSQESIFLLKSNLKLQRLCDSFTFLCRLRLVLSRNLWEGGGGQPGFWLVLGALKDPPLYLQIGLGRSLFGSNALTCSCNNSL